MKFDLLAEDTQNSTKEKCLKVKELLQQGKSVAEVAKELNTSTFNIRYLIRLLRTQFNFSNEEIGYKPRDVTPLSDNELLNIKDLFTQGKNADEIAKTLNIHKDTVFRSIKRIKKKFGFTDKDIPRQRRLTSQEILQIPELRQKGLEIKEIARQLNVHPVSVSRYIAKLKREHNVTDFDVKTRGTKATYLADKIKQLLQTGKSKSDVANELGTSIGVIKKVLRGTSPEELEKLGIINRLYGEKNPQIFLKSKLGTFDEFWNRTVLSKGELNDKTYLTAGKTHDRWMALSILKNRKLIENKSKLRIMSLPHNYLHEKTILEVFNPKQIESYGFNLPRFKDEQIKFGIDVYKETEGRIVPHLMFEDANKALLTHDKLVFKKITPHKFYEYGFIKPVVPEFNSFDIIDLDYKGIPGSANMVVGDSNPWLPPIIAAKKYLKRHGVLMVTYLADTWRKQEPGKHIIQSMLSREGSVLKKYEDYITPDSSYYIDPDKPSSNITRSLSKRENKENTVKNHYAVAAQAGNLYTKNLLKLAEEQGVKLSIEHLNIYPGGATSFMYRICLKKLN